MGAENSSIDRICSSDTRSEALAVSADVNTEISQYHRTHKDDSHQYTQNIEPHRGIDDTDQKYTEKQYIELKEELKASKTEIQRVITQYNLQIYQLSSKCNRFEEKYKNEMQKRATVLIELQDSLKQNQSLKSQQISKDLQRDTEINEYQVSITKLQQQLDAYSSQKGKNKEYESKDVESKLKSKIKEYEMEIAQKNDQINVLQNELNEEVKDVPFSDTQKQFEVLYDEDSRARSLYLCCKSEWINGKDMSFCKWLENNLNERATQTLWNKLKSDTVNAKVFVSLLVTTVMIYKTKLHQQRTNSKDRPRIDASKLKRFVQHLCVWIIRNKGIQTNEKVLIEVKRKYGAVIKEEVFKCKLSLNKQEFSRNISEWVRQYVEDQGVLDNVI